MLIRSRVFNAALLGALVVLAGCGGADGGSAGPQGGAGTSGGSNATGGGSGVGGSAPGGIRECVETPSEIPPSQSTTLGFSANDVLAVTGGAHETDLAWVASSLYATHSRSSMQTPLTLTVAAAPTAVRFVDSQGGGCPTGGSDAPCIVCSSRLEIDVGVTIVTGDGALQEQLGVTLTTMTKSAPSFSTNVDATTVTGTYLTGVVPKAGYEISGLHLEAGYGVGFGGSRTTVPNQWNGFTPARLVPTGSTSAVMQAHGYFPRQTAGIP